MYRPVYLLIISMLAKGFRIVDNVSTTHGVDHMTADNSYLG